MEKELMRKNVVSSMIKQVATFQHGDDDGVVDLEITFSNNQKYMYEAVSQRKVSEMMEADSIGKYFYRRIRNNYQSKRIDN